MATPNIDTVATYSGAVNGRLLNYRPVEDPNTDLPADGLSHALKSTADMTGMALRGRVRFSYAASTVTLAKHYALWGGSSGIAPVVTRVSQGVFDATWPTTIVNALETSNVILDDGWARVASSSGANFFFTDVTITSANVARIYIANSGGTLTDAGGALISVFVV